MVANYDRTPIHPLVRRDQIAALLEGYFEIMDLWRVDNRTARAILGSPAERTFFRWKAGVIGSVPMDTVKRIGYISGIWQGLQLLYSDPHHADKWVNRPNRFLQGQAPIERMSAGDVTDLAVVRQYVDAARSPWS